MLVISCGEDLQNNYYRRRPPRDPFQLMSLIATLLEKDVFEYY